MVSLSTLFVGFTFSTTFVFGSFNHFGNRGAVRRRINVPASHPHPVEGRGATTSETQKKRSPSKQARCKANAAKLAVSLSSAAQSTSSAAPDPVETSQDVATSTPPPAPFVQPTSQTPEVQPTNTPSPPPPATTEPASNQNGNSGSGGSSGSGGLNADQVAQFIELHNQIRSQHDAVPLTWSDNLSDIGQGWAEKCVFQHSHGSLGPYGENLAAGTGSSYDVAAAMKSWTDEISQYDPSNPVPSHYTQVVWRGSTSFGCGLVPDCSGIFDSSFGGAKYFVCEYSPAGNVIGEFGENVH